MTCSGQLALGEASSCSFESLAFEDLRQLRSSKIPASWRIREDMMGSLGEVATSRADGRAGDRGEEEAQSCRIDSWRIEHSDRRAPRTALLTNWR